MTIPPSSDPVQAIRELDEAVTDMVVFGGVTDGEAQYEAARERYTDALVKLSSILSALGSSASPSIDPAQDGLWDARTCSKCGIEAIDYQVVCVSCSTAGSPVHRENRPMPFPPEDIIEIDEDGKVTATGPESARNLAALNRQAGSPVPSCEGTSNPYVASCGAKFDTYEEMAEHERTCKRKADPSSPAGTVEDP